MALLPNSHLQRRNINTIYVLTPVINDGQLFSGSDCSIDTARAQGWALLLCGTGTEFPVQGGGEGAGRPAGCGGEQSTVAKECAVVAGAMPPARGRAICGLSCWRAYS